MMADSGNILATERPFPVQNARRPPSEYNPAMAPAMALTPPKQGLDARDVPPRSGERAMRKIITRTKGGVAILDTGQLGEWKG